MCIVGKGVKEWKRACLEFGLLERKLAILVKMRFTSKVATFQHCLAYKVAILMCYGCQIEVLINKIPSTQTWAIAKIICDVSPVVTTCVVN